MTIAPETLAWLHQSAAVDGAAYSQVLLSLLERVEALEQRSTCKEFLQVPPTPEAAPVVVPVGECPHCGYEGEMARVPQAGEGEG